MKANSEPLSTALYVGLTDLAMSATQIDLGDGLYLRAADATFMSQLVLVNTDEASKRVTKSPTQNRPGVVILPPLPKPSYWHIGGITTKITAELFVPLSTASTYEKRFELAKVLVFLIRLYSNSSVGLHAISDRPFSVLMADDDARPVVIPVEAFPGSYRMQLTDYTEVERNLLQVKDRWRDAFRLYTSSSAFRLAADAIDSGQLVSNGALALVSLWGALESIFSNTKTELKFRVSVLIACYLEEPGEKRRSVQRQVAALYDKRSAAAHGTPKHSGEHLIETYQLLQRVICKMIEMKSVPTKESLERLLFGG